VTAPRAAPARAKDAWSSDKDADLLNFYRGEIRFESDMLSSRPNAFIASQSFLVIGYASSMSASLDRWHNVFSLVFPLSFALLGLALALCARPGIEAARNVIGRWHDGQDELLSRSPGLGGYRLAPAGASVKDRLKRGTMFAKYAPEVFAAAWLCFGAMPIVFHLRG
jgi:hypothetical protein